MDLWLAWYMNKSMTKIIHRQRAANTKLLPYMSPADIAPQVQSINELMVCDHLLIALCSKITTTFQPWIV